MGIIHGGMGRNLYTILFHEFQLHLVPLSPHSAIAKTILIRSLIFHIFTRVGNQTLKQWLKQKQPIILTNVRTFSHSLSYRNIFCFINKYYFLFYYYTHSFLRYTEQKERYVAFILTRV